MKQVSLTVTKRTKTGKEIAKKLRKNGLIPAIVYGSHTRPIPIVVRFNELEKILSRYKGETLIFNLEIINGESIKKQAILKDYQLHPVTDQIIHLDFFVIEEAEPIEIEVPLEFVGKPLGVSKGGILEILKHEVTIECLPNQIPDKITVELSNLDIGDVLHVKDLKVPENIKVKDNPEETIVTIITEKEEREEETLKE
ncbi:MAG: 50S ribosomal protein L25/general stress protein Ctc [Thermodesulfobacteriaceae bacterium]|nr:50S ribosomal protein L25/general stress protein Ctc [Thermodesulfobacteriaceae bacterium]